VVGDSGVSIGPVRCTLSLSQRAFRTELEGFRQPREESAPRAELRRSHTDAGAVANFVDLVERVDDIDTRGQCGPRCLGERRGSNQIDLGVVRQMRAVRNGVVVGKSFIRAQP